jgi:hypothetical protein
MREATVFAHTKVVLAIVMTLGATAAALAHEGKSIVDQYGDDSNYVPDYPAAPRHRHQGQASQHPMSGASREYWSMPRADPCERYCRQPHR